MEFTVNNERKVSQYIEVSPDGILRDLTLQTLPELIIKDSYKAIDFSFENKENKKYIHRIFLPKTGDSDGSLNRFAGLTEQYFKALVKPLVIKETGQDIRFGTENVTFSTPEELFQHYVSKVDMTIIVPVDIKLLYKKNVGVQEIKDGKKVINYPAKGEGSFPVISSEYFMNALSIKKDLENERYPMFTSFNVIELEAITPSASAPEFGVPTTVEEDLAF